MVTFKTLEDSADRLALRISASALLCHLSMCTSAAAIVAASMTLFLRHYIGVFVYFCVALPGIVIVICGLFGCANARNFTFSFDRTQGCFTASAGGTDLFRLLSDIRLVHVERDCGGGGFWTSDVCSYAVALLFSDGRRCRLEGGVSASGSGKGPDNLYEAAQTIKRFVNLPQTNIPLLNVGRIMKDEQDHAMDSAHAEAGLSRWMACQGIVPRFELPISNFDWVEYPEGAVRLPGLYTGTNLVHCTVPETVVLGPAIAVPCAGMRSGRSNSAFNAQDTGAVVMGRPGSSQPVAPQPRQLQVSVPEGTAGTDIVAVGPDGTHITVRIPADAQVGETIRVQY